MSLADLFDCTFIVNLPDRKDRRRAITRELQNAGMPLTPGSVELFPAVRPDDPGQFPSRGVRGCFLSHLRILQQARARNLDTALIIEDDLVLSPLLLKSDGCLQKLMDQPWDMVYLGHVADVRKDPPIRLNRFDGPLATSHFYAVRKQARERLIDFLEAAEQRPPGHPDGGPMHLDGALTMFRQCNPDILTLIAEPNLGWQRPSRSDIHSTWMQSAPVFREAYNLARFVRGVLKPARS